MHVTPTRKANWIGHILCRDIIEWKEGIIEVIGRQDISN